LNGSNVKNTQNDEEVTNDTSMVKGNSVDDVKPEAPAMPPSAPQPSIRPPNWIMNTTALSPGIPLDSFDTIKRLDSNNKKRNKNNKNRKNRKKGRKGKRGRGKVDTKEVDDISPYPVVSPGTFKNKTENPSSPYPRALY
jgi:hypothetical protein